MHPPLHFVQALFLLLMALPVASLPAQEAATTEVWGQTDSGEDVQRVTLTHPSGITIRIMTLGATLIDVTVPDREGIRENVTLHRTNLDGYLAGHPLLGSIVGRFANRIDTGGFSIDGERFDLETVNARTGVHIHGGKTGFQKQVWKLLPLDPEKAEATFQIVSADGHEGFPGEVTAQVTYRLEADQRLVLEYHATTTKPTHVNLTNHVYWNLAGEGTILNHRLTMPLESRLDFDERKIPTGDFSPVAGTPFDFRETHTIGSRIEETGGGYDHCYVVSLAPLEKPILVARAEDPASGRVMEVFTTASGAQFYTANGLRPSDLDGGDYGPFAGFCLECQHFPDAPNHPDFPTTLLRPGEEYRQQTVYQFSMSPQP